MTAFEAIGWAATCGAVAGVVLNNYRMRVCFIVWLATNAVSGLLHVRGYLAGDPAMLALAARDAVFSVLAVHGYLCWGGRTKR
jgi:hypothetical protein